VSVCSEDQVRSKDAWCFGEGDMTNEQVDRAVQHLCEQLHVAIRLKGTEALPPNARDIGFDVAVVKTVLMSGLRLAGVLVEATSSQPSGDLEPPRS